MNKPFYECAKLLNLNPNDGITVVALKSKAEIGSPRYLILLGLVLFSSVILLAKSAETFLPITPPKPVNKPPSENPIAASAVVPMDTPPATPAPTISFLIMFFNNGFDMLPDTVGAPKVLLCIIPYVWVLTLFFFVLFF